MPNVAITSTQSTASPSSSVTTTGTCSDCEDLSVVIKRSDGLTVAPPPAPTCAEGCWTLVWTAPDCLPSGTTKVTISATCEGDLDEKDITLDCP